MSKLLVNFIQTVNADHIRDERLDGVDYLVVSSKTMPDDIVMNGIMYPADQIDATIHTIDDSPAPMSHPMIDGKYVSAKSQRAQNAFNKAGGMNRYIKKDGDSHIVEKWFDKEMLENTSQGKRLLSAIEKKEPINSSTGVIINKVASAGQNKHGKYSYIAEIHNFDHDAVLIGEKGAATPEQGVGLMVNGEEEIDVLFVNLTSGLDMSVSANKLREKLQEEVKRTFGGEYKCVYLHDHNADTVIFEVYENGVSEQYKAQYTVDGDVVTIGQAAKVESEVVYKSTDTGLFANAYRAFKDMFNPKTNHSEQETDPMKEKMITALNAAGVKTEGLNEDQLFEAYNTQMTAKAVIAQEPQLTKDDIAEIAANAAKAAVESFKVDAAKAAKTALVDSVIAANANYTEENKEELMATPEAVLNSLIPQKRAANAKSGISVNNKSALSADLPE